jgi:hypothetical protein
LAVFTGRTFGRGKSVIIEQRLSKKPIAPLVRRPSHVTELTDFTSDSPKSQIFICEPEKIDCPRHGIHSHIISSTIEGHKGHWCQLCWLETLGEPLPLISEEK